ncbi:hypothetical protein BEWA_009070 [Theileria equi strain WA]|uniref:Uncharacterized protein n=1 Tax=Theileria equi strain WA TaxID=1537102 RepID=L0B101_THEEQ|nr:hypothetical protein BEWA_009070 [Theileria equi strain WA]AFZ81495.1 hypothetical protein BEWA_009070 [Theileria equi strain WA]|eukprot:XP_004831161.1 hypothetical protein BEWA_009070 [Theileria equi strain WA]
MSKDGLQKGAMFMAGLTLLQSLRVALTGAKFAMDRFKIPQQHVSSFINMVHNPMELATFTGIVIINILSWTGEWFNKSSKWFAIFTNATLCCSFILLLYAFTSGGSLGNLTFYYWTIVFVSFIYGLNVAAVMNVGSANASFFNVGIPLSGIQVCIYYYVFAKLAERYQWSNISYRIIFWQLVIAIIISAASAIVWIAVATGPIDNSSNPGQYIGLAGVSPILMGMVGMGGIYAFYPAIAPYKLTDVGTGYTIDLVVLFVSAVPGILIVILCACSIGPDRPWNTSGHKWWHAAWSLALPHITAMVLCLCTLHYPDSRLAASIKSSGLKVGVITVTLKFCEEGLKAVSYAGSGKQVDQCSEGIISSLNTFTSQGLMIILAFTGDGYLKTYSKYEHDRSKWPTRNFGFWRSISYWAGNGAYVACKSVKSSFTTNVRCKVLGKSEALLIVYADEEF